VVEDHAGDDDRDDARGDVGDDAGDDAGGYSASVDSGVGGDSAAKSGSSRVRRTRSCILLDHLQSFHPNLGF
jgi:hypothetical protein